MCFILSDTDQKICINDNKMARPSSKLAELVSFRPTSELSGTRRLLPSTYNSVLQAGFTFNFDLFLRPVRWSYIHDSPWGLEHAEHFNPTTMRLYNVLQFGFVSDRAGGGAHKFIPKHTKVCIVFGCKTNNRPLESI